MGIGAALPDMLDAVSIASRGHFAQGIGHSFLGLAVLGLPLGLAAWFLLHAASMRAHGMSPGHAGGRAWNRLLHTFSTGVRPGQFLRKWPRVIGSMGLGGLSHLVFDLISHGGFPWLMPWIPKIKIFPAWWYTVWFRFDVPGYRHYAVGPYGMVWLLLTILGAYVLIRPAFRKPEKPASAGGEAHGTRPLH